MVSFFFFSYTSSSFPVSPLCHPHPLPLSPPPAEQPQQSTDPSGLPPTYPATPPQTKATQWLRFHGRAVQEGCAGGTGRCVWVGDHQGSAHSFSGSLLSQVILSLLARRCEEEEGGGASAYEPQLQDSGRACLAADAAPQHPGRAQVRPSTIQQRCPCFLVELFSGLNHFVYLPLMKDLLETVFSVKYIFH